MGVSQASDLKPIVTRMRQETTKMVEYSRMINIRLTSRIYRHDVEFDSAGRQGWDPCASAAPPSASAAPPPSASAALTPSAASSNGSSTGIVVIGKDMHTFVSVDLADFVEVLRAQAATGLSLDNRPQLFFEGKELKNGKQLKDYHCYLGCHVYTFEEMDGDEHSKMGLFDNRRFFPL